MMFLTEATHPGASPRLPQAPLSCVMWDNELIDGTPFEMGRDPKDVLKSLAGLCAAMRHPRGRALLRAKPELLTKVRPCAANNQKDSDRAARSGRTTRVELRSAPLPPRLRHGQKRPPCRRDPCGFAAAPADQSHCAAGGTQGLRYVWGPAMLHRTQRAADLAADGHPDAKNAAALLESLTETIALMVALGALPARYTHPPTPSTSPRPVLS